jgi:hypothetical protein
VGPRRAGGGPRYRPRTFALDFVRANQMNNVSGNMRVPATSSRFSEAGEPIVRRCGAGTDFQSSFWASRCYQYPFFS